MDNEGRREAVLSYIKANPGCSIRQVLAHVRSMCRQTGYNTINSLIGDGLVTVEIKTAKDGSRYFSLTAEEDP